MRTWPCPCEMLGGKPSSQVAEALWIAKLMASRCVVYGHSCVVVRLDISAAYDSLLLREVRDEFCRFYNPQVAASLRWLDHMMHNQTLQFQMQSHTWEQKVHRGCVQGGCHSPLIFSRILANRLQSLKQKWLDRSEASAFRFGLLLVWYILFVDDATFVFTDAAQTAKLFQEVVEVLAKLGLRINVSKTKVLGWPPGVPLPEVLREAKCVYQCIFLGMPLSMQDDLELKFAMELCRRAVSAFFSNKRLFHHPHAKIEQKLQFLQSLVVPTFYWAVGALVPSGKVLHYLRLQGITVYQWLLQLRPHSCWWQVRQLCDLRHACKLWVASYGRHWDHLALVQHWRLIGHMFRSTYCLSRDAVSWTEVWQLSPCRARTGPDNSGARQVHKFLHRQGITIEVAQNRQQWDQLADAWCHFWGSRQPVVRCNVYPCSPEHMQWNVKCVQGCFSGGQVFFLSRDESFHLHLAHLHRRDGWVETCLSADATFRDVIQAILQDVAPHVRHVRLCSRVLF